MNAARKLVVWDWNGTLFDDVHVSLGGAQAALGHFGVTDVTLAQFQEAFSPPIAKLYYYFGVDDARLQTGIGEAQDKFHAHYEMTVSTGKLHDGAAPLLTALKQNYVSNIILSNHLVDSINRQLDRLGVADAIGHVSAYADAASQWKEPKGKRLERYMTQHGIAPGNAIIIGDTPEEIEIAREYGLTGVALTGNYASRARLEAVRPEYMIDSLHEFAGILRAKGFLS